MPERLRLHRFEPASRANGPGLRAVVWVQGCTLGCPSCFNPETHDPRAGELVPVPDLANRIAAAEPGIEGLTISGGEPLQQLPAVARLVRQLRQQTGLSILLFSGYSLEEIRAMGGGPALLADLDVLIAGRYNPRLRSAQGGLLGSSNQAVHYLSGRYTPADLSRVPQAEMVITATGEVWTSGINPPEWPHGA